MSAAFDESYRRALAAVGGNKRSEGHLKIRLSHYGVDIQKILAEIGRPEVDPRHIEAHMRVVYRTLDGITNFRSAVKKAVKDYDAEGGVVIGEQLAKSYGL